MILFHFSIEKCVILCRLCATLVPSDLHGTTVRILYTCFDDKICSDFRNFMFKI